jgi:hypothetical protein
VVANARRQGAKDLIEIFNHLADKRVAPQRPLTTLEPNDA